MEQIFMSSERLGFWTFFRKNVTYDNIKTHKKFLSWRYIFGKTTGSLSLFRVNTVFFRTDLYENAASSILIFSTKKRFFSVLKNVFVFEKICFKFKVLKTFKTFSECHIKTYRSLKRKAILKIRSTVFRGAYALSVGFEMKPLKKNVFLC